jgi:hypothetical protein
MPPATGPRASRGWDRSGVSPEIGGHRRRKCSRRSRAAARLPDRFESAVQAGEERQRGRRQQPFLAIDVGADLDPAGPVDCIRALVPRP